MQLATSSLLIGDFPSIHFTSNGPRLVYGCVTSRLCAPLHGSLFVKMPSSKRKRVARAQNVYRIAVPILFALIAFPLLRRHNAHDTLLSAEQLTLIRSALHSNLSALSRNFPRSLSLHAPPSCRTQWYHKKPHLLPRAALIIAAHADTPALAVLRTAISAHLHSPPALRHIYIASPSLPSAITEALHSIPRIRLTTSTRANAAHQARKCGAQALIFLSPGTETSKNWLEPLLAELHEDGIKQRHTIILPVLLQLHHRTLAPPRNTPIPIPVHAHDWALRPISFYRSRNAYSTAPVRSPLLPHSDYAISATFYNTLNHTADQVDLAFRAWGCGGAIATAPCSRIARRHHIATPRRHARLQAARRWLGAYEPLARLANDELPHHHAAVPATSCAPTFDRFMGIAFPEMQPSAQIMLGDQPARGLRAWGQLRLALAGLCAALGADDVFKVVRCEDAGYFLMSWSGFVMAAPRMTAACITRDDDRLIAQRCEFETAGKQEWSMESSRWSNLFAVRDGTPECLSARPGGRLHVHNCTVNPVRHQMWQWQFQGRDEEEDGGGTDFADGGRRPGRGAFEEREMDARL